MGGTECGCNPGQLRYQNQSRAVMLPISEGWYFYFRTGPSGSVRKPSTKAEFMTDQTATETEIEIKTEQALKDAETDELNRVDKLLFELKVSNAALSRIADRYSHAEKYAMSLKDQLAAVESCVRNLNKKLKFCEDELATQRESENRRCEEFKAALLEDYETKLRIAQTPTL